MVYAYLVRFCAVALQSVDAGYARLSPPASTKPRACWARRGCGCFAQLHAPLLQRAALSAMLLVFVDVMKELPATLVLRPFDSDTLAVVAYQLARDERLAEAALPSLAIVLVGLHRCCCCRDRCGNAPSKALQALCDTCSFDVARASGPIAA